MKIVNVLVENYRKTDIICPLCGHSKKVAIEFNENSKDWWVACIGCGYESAQAKTPEEAIAKHYILTGGPVPGKIKPPYEHAVLLDNAERLGYDKEKSKWFGWVNYERKPISSTPVQWWFYPIHRTTPIITDWLNTPWEADA